MEIICAKPSKDQLPIILRSWSKEYPFWKLILRQAQDDGKGEMRQFRLTWNVRDREQRENSIIFDQKKL